MELCGKVLFEVVPPFQVLYPWDVSAAFFAGVAVDVNPEEIEEGQPPVGREEEVTGDDYSEEATES